MPDGEMPRYRCRKEIYALKIDALSLQEDGSAVMGVEDQGFANFEVSKFYMEKHDPQIGGYYVVYENGYESFSPAEAFEKGYIRI